MRRGTGCAHLVEPLPHFLEYLTATGDRGNPVGIFDTLFGQKVEPCFDPLQFPLG